MKKGMSLIVLVITILVMIILAGVVIVSLSQNNPIGQANTAVILSDLNAAKSTVSLYAANKLANNTLGAGSVSTTKLSEADGELTGTAITIAGKTDKFYKTVNTKLGISAPKLGQYVSDESGNVYLLVPTSDTVDYKNDHVIHQDIT
ncbi:MAG: hypothetical protein RR922_05360 [Clostridia bacterium]